MWIDPVIDNDNSSSLYVGICQEHSPARGLQTLFINGIETIDIIAGHLYQRERACEHIYLGAANSFDPGDWKSGDYTKSDAWDGFIKSVLSLGVLTTLCFDVKHTEWILEGGYAEDNNFIPMVSVKIPYIEQLRYNAVIKIDDIGFNKSNPGLWCHNIYDLMDRNKFTNWKYGREVRKI